VALSKADLPDTREVYEDLKAQFGEKGIKLELISSPTREGLKDVIEALRTKINQAADTPS
jgi:hypothetical protein